MILTFFPFSALPSGTPIFQRFWKRICKIHRGLSNIPKHIGLVLWHNPSLPSEMNDTIGQRSKCKLAVQINKIPLNLLHSSISKLEKQMGANVICFLESHRFTQMWTTARISWVLRDKCTYYKAYKICTKMKQQCHTYYFNSKYIFNSSKDFMKYYENYLVDVTLTLAVCEKESDHRRWETRTSFDNHVELQSSMSRSQVVDHTKVSSTGSSYPWV